MPNALSPLKAFILPVIIFFRYARFYSCFSRPAVLIRRPEPYNFKSPRLRGVKGRIVNMVIYVIKPGDSLYAIAKRYGVAPGAVIKANMPENPDRLAVGQSIVIPQANRYYTVRSGDTVYSIARRFGADPQNIINANPQSAGGAIQPGDILTVPPGESRRAAIEVNGYVFPGSVTPVVSGWLPYLTYLSIFSYRVSSAGGLDSIPDAPLISAAKENRAAPMMVITNIRLSGGFDSDIAHSVLTGSGPQAALIDNVCAVMKDKGYYYLNIDFEYVYPDDRQSYDNFLGRIAARLHPLGCKVTTAVAPKLTAGQKGLLYEAHDYPVHGATADRVILMTYEWGYLSGPPQAVAPLDQVKKVLDYAVTVIPRGKILLGIPNYGYDWALPYIRGTKAQTFSNQEAVARAVRNNAQIKYDETAQSPYYNYYDADGRQHIVWFEDARSISRKLMLITEYGLAGASYWTAGLPFMQNLVLLASMYDVKKLT
jgi:spore germination protein